MTIFVNCVNMEKAYNFNEEIVCSEVKKLLESFLDKKEIIINNIIKKMLESKQDDSEELFIFINHLKWLQKNKWDCSFFIKN